MRQADFLQALTVVVIWGFNFVVIKTAVSEIPPLALTALRFAVVASLVAPFFPPARDQLLSILGLAVVMGFGHFGMLFIGLNGADASTTALMIQLGIPFSSILAAVFSPICLAGFVAWAWRSPFPGRQCSPVNRKAGHPWRLGLC